MGIQIGSEVQLKSGGPIMTVKEIMGNGESVNCVWFDQGELKSSNFVVATLEQYTNHIGR